MVTHVAPARVETNQTTPLRANPDGFVGTVPLTADAAGTFNRPADAEDTVRHPAGAVVAVGAAVLTAGRAVVVTASTVVTVGRLARPLAPTMASDVPAGTTRSSP